MYKFCLLFCLLLVSFAGKAQLDTIFHPGISDSLLQSIDSTAKADSALVFTGKVIIGKASFYSNKFEGRKTATGEIFRHKGFTGASNNLKLNTWVKITNIRNGKSVVLRINDRMHATMKTKGRVIDMTKTAAKKLDFLKKGITKVKMEVVNPPKSPKKT